MQSLYAKLVEKKDLSFKEAQEAVGALLRGEVSPVLTAGFLTALRVKGETVDEIAGCAQAMRKAALNVRVNESVVVDTCGTGGDRQGSFNISTAAAFVVAGAGFTVAKHGNRSVSSHCGSADVLEALGVNINPGPDLTQKALNGIGIAFFFAPAFHPAMKHVMPVRKELAVRTVFNILGPLCNPAGANAQVIGVFSKDFLMPLARVLLRLGAKNAMLVHGQGHDEIVLHGTTAFVEIANGKLRAGSLSLARFGVKKIPKGTLKGATPQDNAVILKNVLDGKKDAAREATLINAAAAILVAGRQKKRKDIRNLKDAYGLAARSVDSGRAREKLNQLIALGAAAV